MSEWIRKDDIIKLLMDERELFEEYGFKIVKPIKLYHGFCCCCLECGRSHDECVCTHNWWVEKLNELEIIEAEISRTLTSKGIVMPALQRKIKD